METAPRAPATGTGARYILHRHNQSHRIFERHPDEIYAAATGKPLLNELIAAHQTVDDQVRWNPQHHCLVLKGAFDECGTLIPVPLSGLDHITEVFCPRHQPQVSL